MALIKPNQKLPISISIQDSRGNPARVDGIPAWSVSNPDLASVEAAADGMSALITPIGPLGSFQAKIEADADLGSGITPLIGALDCEIVAGDASIINMVAGESIDQ